LDRSFCGWTVLFGLGLAALAGFGAWRTWSVYLSGTPEPVEVRLADVTPEGAGGNVHVRIRDMEFGIDYVPSVNEKTGQWRSVVVPLLSGGRVRALLDSEHVADGNDLQALEKQPVLTGIVGPSPPYLLKPADVARLSARYPGVDFSSLPVLDVSQHFPTPLRVWTFTAVLAVGLAWAALAGVLWGTSGRPVRVSAEAASPAGRLRAAGYSPVEGLGELHEAYTVGPKAGRIFAAATFVVIFGGFGSAVLFGSDPAEFSLAWTVGISVIELAFVALFVYVAASPLHMAALYERGLASHYGRDTTACRWDEVESATGLLRHEVTISAKGTTSTLYVPGPIRLCCADGRVVTVGMVEDEMKLVNAVRHEVVRHQLSRALEVLGRGEKVSIGPLELDRTGIAGPGGWWVKWVDLGDAWSGDKLVVQEQDSKKPLWSGSLSTPNAALLVELTEAARRGEVG
jgi:hypothetical protein